MTITPVEQAAIKLSIEKAKKSQQENNRNNPFVGAVAVRNDEIIDSAFRGEMEPGEHAEFTLLEKKLTNVSLVDCTIFTTLEPCTSRNHPKLPCVERLIERKVKKVWVGMVDPNKDITGKGILRLREANIEVALYPPVEVAILEELNRHFIRDQKLSSKNKNLDPEILGLLNKRSLDEWYVGINRIYWNRNYYKSVAEIFAHLVEVIGGLSLLASEKRSKNFHPENNLTKAIAWWLTLCGKLGINSVEEMLWDKFPSICPYCQLNPHVQRVCDQKKIDNKGPDWDTIRKLGEKEKRPKTVTEWQLMFDSIYPLSANEDYKPVFARLVEELGELAESIRVFPAEPGYFLSEACDVFAWLMRIQNIYDYKQNRKAGETLVNGLAEGYPNYCLDCGNEVCGCAPILKSTVGRIAHEVPIKRNTTTREERFLSSDQASEKFGNL